MSALVAPLLGMRLHAMTLAQTADTCVRAAKERRPLLIAMVNAAKLVRLRTDGALRAAVEAADLVLADGMAVVWASRLLGEPLPERVTGIDLLEALIAHAEREDLGVYFLGARDEVLRNMLAGLRMRHPRLRVAGHRNGYFSADQEPEIVREIRASGTHFVFVGIPTPRKEIFLQKWRAALGPVVCHGVGGSFDVLGGFVQRAPARWQRLGLEWLYRLAQEPRRLWRRYLVTNTVFVGMVARAWIDRWVSRR